MWAVAAFVLVYDPDPRTAYGAGFSRMLYTLIGCVFSVGLISLFGVHKWLLPLGLSGAVLICGYGFGFRGGWRALLVCVALVIGSSLIDPAGDIHIALTRGIEVAAGSALAILFSLPFGWFAKRASGGRSRSAEVEQTDRSAGNEAADNDGGDDAREVGDEAGGDGVAGAPDRH